LEGWLFSETVLGWRYVTHKQDGGDAVPLGLRLMQFTPKNEFEGNQATVPLKTTHTDEDVGGGDLVLAEAGEELIGQSR